MVLSCGELHDFAFFGKDDDREARKPLFPVVDENQMLDILHRISEHRVNNEPSMSKHELLKTFMKDHTQAYALVAGPRRVVKRRPGFVVLREQDLEQASLHQKNHACKYNLNQKARTQVQFESESIRRSPIDVATELIAKSGVWRSQEQYLATLFMLQPIQNLWLAAWENDSLADLQSTLTLSRLIKDMDVCRLFLHGPGGSGKMYSITEVVVKVVKFFSVTKVYWHLRLHAMLRDRQEV